MIETLTLKRKRDNKGNDQWYIDYTSTTQDTTGIGGEWKGSGTYCQLVRCMGYWIGIAWGMHPIFVFKTIEEIAEYLEEEYGVILEKSVHLK